MSVIELENVGKRYRQYREEQMLLKRVLQPHRRRERADLWALRDLTFEAASGETVGVIGRNGSGKTTLLRLLSGVSAPTTGRLRVEGIVAPLIGVGVGFDGELTGRENVLINGRLLGLAEEQVAERFDDIVAFAELPQFIDTPVKFYSTGMFLRLAFAVAIHTDPDVFLLDEILAVGDMAFQLKCVERMRDIQSSGTTIVVVTHSLEMLDRLAPRTLVLDRGELVFDGATEDAASIYQEIMKRDYDQAEGEGTRRPEDWGRQLLTSDATLDVELRGADGQPRRQFATGEPIHLLARVDFERPVSDPNVGLMLMATGKGGLFMLNTLPGEYRGEHGPDRPLEVEIVLTNHLLRGNYHLMAGVFDAAGEHQLGRSGREPFFVSSQRRGEGYVDLEPVVKLDGKPVALADDQRLGFQE